MIILPKGSLTHSLADSPPVGWFLVAIMCLFQSFLVLIVFPRRGSKLIGKDKVSLDLGENAGAQTWRERALRFATLGFIILAIALANAFLSAWVSSYYFGGRFSLSTFLLADSSSLFSSCPFPSKLRRPT